MIDTILLFVSAFLAGFVSDAIRKAVRHRLAMRRLRKLVDNGQIRLRKRGVRDAS